MIEIGDYRIEQYTDINRIVIYIPSGNRLNNCELACLLSLAKKMMEDKK